MTHSPCPIRLRLKLLGEPQILYNDVPVTGFISGKAQALLIYLAATGRTHTRDTLATLFWDEMPESSAKKNLTKALSNLRKLISGFVQIDSQLAGLAWDEGIEVDLIFFQETLADEKRHPSVRQDAVDLYRGDFLSGFHVKDAPRFEEWVWGERERIHRMAIQELEAVAKWLSSAKRSTDAIVYLRRLLELDPLYEPAHGQLMMALFNSGQKSAAFSQYKICQNVLAEELAAEPSPALQELYQRLKRSGQPAPHNIPQLSPIVGREFELTEATDLLTDEGCRLLTIVGPGGIGKTELALHIARHYVKEAAGVEGAEGAEGEVSATAAIVPFSDGIFTVSLAPLVNEDGVLAATAEVLTFAFQEQGQPLEQLCAYLQRKRILLIMDNCEHLLPNSAAANSAQSSNLLPTLSALLENAPGLKILVTSRVRLGVQVEHVFHLSGVECPNESIVAGDNLDGGIPPDSQPEQPRAIDETTMAELSSYGAVELFERSARRLRPTFSLTVQNVQSVVSICNQVQGMPLGILLAASWISVLSPAEILTELQQSLDLLETQEKDVPTRQRSVRNAFDYTWRMLSEREQEFYQKLSYIRGTFTRQAAQKIAGASLRELMAMVDHSLITPAIEGRFSLHGLLRQFGLEKLEANPELMSAVREQHGRYYVNLMKERATLFKGAEQENALHQTEADGENIRVAWDWAIAKAASGEATVKAEGEATVAQMPDGTNPLDPLSQIIDGVCQFYIWRGRFHEGVRGLKQCAQQLARIQQHATPAVRLYGHTLSWQGKFTRYVGEQEEALQLLHKSREILGSLDNSGLELRPEKAFLQLNLGDATRESDRDEAHRHYESSLALYHETQDEWGQANALAALGWLIQHWGNYDEARQIFQKDLSARKALGDKRGEAESLRSVGGVALYQGDLAKAEQLIRESIEIAEELGDSVGKAASLGKLGEVLISQGGFAEAQPPLDEAQSVYINLGLSDSAAYVDAILGLSHLHQGHYGLARSSAEKTLSHFRQRNISRGIAYASLALGWTLLVEESTPESLNDAETYLTEAKALYEELGQQDELGQVHALLGLTYHRQNRPTDAAQNLQLALSIAERIHAFMPRALALAVTVGQTTQSSAEAASKSQQVNISKLRSELTSYRLVSASRWFKEVIHQPPN